MSFVVHWADCSAGSEETEVLGAVEQVSLQKALAVLGPRHGSWEFQFELRYYLALWQWML